MADAKVKKVEVKKVAKKADNEEKTKALAVAAEAAVAEVVPNKEKSQEIAGKILAARDKCEQTAGKAFAEYGYNAGGVLAALRAKMPKSFDKWCEENISTISRAERYNLIKVFDTMTRAALPKPEAVALLTEYGKEKTFAVLPVVDAVFEPTKVVEIMRDGYTIENDKGEEETFDLKSATVREVKAWSSSRKEEVANTTGGKDKKGREVKKPCLATLFLKATANIEKWKNDLVKACKEPTFKSDKAVKEAVRRAGIARDIVNLVCTVLVKMGHEIKPTAGAAKATQAAPVVQAPIKPVPAKKLVKPVIKAVKAETPVTDVEDVVTDAAEAN